MDSRDPDIAAGIAARKAGRHAQAVERFAAAMRDGAAPAAAACAFDTLRELEVSAFLVRRLLHRLRRPTESHRGILFAGDVSIEGMQSERLRHFAEAAAPADGGRRLVVWAKDRSGGARPGPAGIAAVPDPAPSAVAEAARGIAAWRLGDRRAASEAFTLSLLYPRLPAQGAAATLRATCRGHQLLHAGSSFYAVPVAVNPIVQPHQGEMQVMAHRAPPALRQWLLRLLPGWLVGLLRRAAYASPLLAKKSLEDMPHASDLATLLRRIGRAG